MSERWDGLKGAFVGPVKAALGDFWAEAGVPEFAEAKLSDMAREKWLALNAPTPEQRDAHEENLGDLAAHVKDEALKLAGKASNAARALLGTLLEAVGGILVGLAKSQLEERLGGGGQ